ncbi:MAG: radical SAM protein [Actinobacteria bacterium]|nr:radical SAM protein [Actinomycetota bacterium]
MNNDSGSDKRNMVGLPTVRQALLAERVPGGIRCGLCRQRCVITEDEKGFCGTRMNIEGELFTLVYGDIVSAESRPMEIKPFFHFHPGKSTMTICSPSCNLRCPWCQNSPLSRAAPRPLRSRYVGMEEIIEAARAAGDIGLCVSFTEPTMLFEYCLGLFREARSARMVNTFVSNGYMTPEALHMLARAGLDAINIDVKGSDEVYREYCEGREGDLPVWENIKGALELGLHVEVVHLVVTGLSDNEEAFREICRKHLQFAGPAVPLHVTAYRPAHEYHKPATSIGFLEYAYRAAKEAGILFPYIGNVPGHPYENTYCPKCGELLLERSGFRLERDLTEEGRCNSCGYLLPIVW